jgi:hypothetical protein
MRCHFLGMLERAAIGEIGGNAGRAKRVAADCLGNAGRGGASPYHAPSVGLAHRLVGKNFAVVAARGAEQPALAVFDNAGGIDIGAQRLGERVVARHRVLLAAFLVQPDGPTGAAWPQILDLHRQGRVAVRLAGDRSGCAEQSGGSGARPEACREDRQDAGAGRCRMVQAVGRRKGRGQTTVGQAM